MTAMRMWICLLVVSIAWVMLPSAALAEGSEAPGIEASTLQEIQSWLADWWAAVEGTVTMGRDGATAPVPNTGNTPSASWWFPDWRLDHVGPEAEPNGARARPIGPAGEEDASTPRSDS